MKVAAILIASVLFAVLMGFHKYFAFLIAKLEAAEDERNEKRQ